MRQKIVELKEQLEQRAKVAEQKVFAMKMEMQDDLEQRLKIRNDLWQRRLDHKEKSLNSLHQYEVANKGNTLHTYISLFFQIANFEASIDALVNHRNELSEQIDEMKLSGTYSDVIDLDDSSLI